ncbi:MAG: hypothetical protein M1457_12005, partial [bacterium]|nr:hypothetical protein [bacterium]
MSVERQTPAPAASTAAARPAAAEPAGLVGRHPRLRKAGLLALDSAVLALAPGLAYEVGFNFEPQRFSAVYHNQYLYIVVPLVAVRLAMLAVLGLYAGISRYAGFYELTRSAMACLAGTLLLAAFNVLSNYIPHLNGYPMHDAGHILRVPWGVVVIDALLSVAGVALVRVGRRMVVETLAGWRPGAARRVLIVGAGREGGQA